ncbi:MAG: DUF4390 domain-containing protein [Candidatus Eisenbacteria bacterium]
MLPCRTGFHLSHACALLALVCGVLPALAFDFSAVSATRDETSQLWVQLQLDDPIEQRVEQSLARGMPATLELHAELWRRRTGWFDRMERSFDASIRLRYDVWDRSYRLERAGARPFVTHSLDSLELALSRPIDLPVGALQRLPQRARCYCVVSAALKPLNVADAEEVEGWISGEARSQGSAGVGILTRLPSSVFDAVRNFAGFGDLRTRAITPEFTPATLARR